MDLSRRSLLQSVGAGSLVTASACLGVVPGDDDGDDGDDGTPADDAVAERRVASGATPTPHVDDIPEGGDAENFELVGHAPLYDEHQHVDEEFEVPRGSNGDITIAGDYVYVGSFIGHQPPLIVDVSDPEDPEVVGPIPDTIPGVGNGIEDIEASGDVLVVGTRQPLGGLEFDVPEGEPERALSIYDISDPEEPELVTRYDYEGLNTHACSLWRDPEDPERLLAVQSFDDVPNIKIVDLTGCPDPDECEPEVVAEWALETQTGIDEYTHEAMLSTDGNRVYVAQYDAGTFLLDSSNLMEALRNGGDCDPEQPSDTPGDDHCLTLLNPDIEDRLHTDPPFTAEWHHTPLKVPDRPYLLMTAEATGPRWDQETEEVLQGSCPGAFTRTVYVGEDEYEHHPSRDGGALRGDLHPQIAGVFGLPEQQLEHCTEDGWVEDAAPPRAWLSPHYALVFPDLAFVTYYGSGLRAIDISNAATPMEAGYFFNDPVDDVRWTSYGIVGERETDDDGTIIARPNPTANHMFAFSFPILKDGYLIYGDIHSGLYVLEYDGPHADQLPDDGTCLSGNPGAIEAGYEPCPPYGETEWTGG